MASLGGHNSQLVKKKPFSVKGNFIAISVDHNHGGHTSIDESIAGAKFNSRLGNFDTPMLSAGKILKIFVYNDTIGATAGTMTHEARVNGSNVNPRLFVSVIAVSDTGVFQSENGVTADWEIDDIIEINLTKSGSSLLTEHSTLMIVGSIETPT